MQAGEYAREPNLLALRARLAQNQDAVVDAAGFLTYSAGT